MWMFSSLTLVVLAHHAFLQTYSNDTVWELGVWLLWFYLLVCGDILLLIGWQFMEPLGFGYRGPVLFHAMGTGC